MREHFPTEYAARLEHEKLESLKELAYGASHEINNPLANIAARAQSLLADEPNPERRRTLTAIHRQAMRAHEMISDLMLFARPPKLTLAPCDIDSVTEQVVTQRHSAAAERQIALTLLSEGSLPEVSADITQISVAIDALVVNAIEAVGTGGKVEVIARTSDESDRSVVEIVVRDTGPGISDEVRPHIFDPFFSGREAGRGLGFGLSKCWRIVTDHGGDIIVAQSSGPGAEFTIRLPVAAAVHAI